MEEKPAEVISTLPLHERIAALVPHLEGEYPPHTIEDVRDASIKLRELHDALRVAKDTIKVWHGQNAWDIYDRSSPEMKTINAALSNSERADG